MITKLISNNRICLTIILCISSYFNTFHTDLNEDIYRGSEGADNLIDDEAPITTPSEFTLAKMITLSIVAFLVSAIAGSLIVFTNNVEMRIWLNGRISRTFRQ